MDEALRLIAMGLKKAEKQEDGTLEAKITEEELKKQGIKDTMSPLSWRVSSPAKDGLFCNLVSVVKFEDGVLQISFFDTAAEVIDAVQEKSAPAEDWHLKYGKTEYTAEDLLEAAEGL